MRDQRPLAAALAEVAAWLAAPDRGREFLLVYLDDQPDLLAWARRAPAPPALRSDSNAAARLRTSGAHCSWHGPLGAPGQRLRVPRTARAQLSM